VIPAKIVGGKAVVNRRSRSLRIDDVRINYRVSHSPYKVAMSPTFLSRHHFLLREIMDNPLLTKPFQPDALQRLVNGALKDCVSVHGPITKNLISSASRRVVGQIRGRILEITRQNMTDALIEAQKKLIEQQQETIRSLSKNRHDLLILCQEHNLLK